MLSLSVLTQAFEGISYQTEVSDNNGNELANLTIDVRFTIHLGSTTVATIYQGNHTVNTNNYGIFTAIIESQKAQLFPASAGEQSGRIHGYQSHRHSGTGAQDGSIGRGE